MSKRPRSARDSQPHRCRGRIVQPFFQPARHPFSPSAPVKPAWQPSLAAFFAPDRHSCPSLVRGDEARQMNDPPRTAMRIELGIIKRSETHALKLEKRVPDCRTTPPSQSLPQPLPRPTAKWGRSFFGNRLSIEFDATFDWFGSSSSHLCCLILNTQLAGSRRPLTVECQECGIQLRHYLLLRSAQTSCKEKKSSPN